MSPKEEALKIMRRWKSSLEDYGKIDKWSMEKDYSVLSMHVMSSEPKSHRDAVRSCRDYSLAPDCSTERLLLLVRKACAKLDGSTTRKRRRDDLIGQAKKYRSTTGRLFNEKLRFLDGVCLRNVDVDIEDGRTSRKVRRIVEKRMCQAYHSQNHGLHKDGNRQRYYMHRATSFQLHNIGQVENVRFVSRGDSTHWKRLYDPHTGGVVFKKKRPYDSIDEALEGLRLFKENNPSDRGPMSVYLCSHCGRYHIGHMSDRTAGEIHEPVAYQQNSKHNAACQLTVG